MHTFTQTIFLGLLGFATLDTAAVQAQTVAARSHPSVSKLSQPRPKGERKVVEALRGINTTVVRPGQSVNYNWDLSLNRWLVSYKQEYTYDTGARVTQELYRDSATSVPNNRILYTYNAQGKETSYTYQSWNGSTWENNSRGLATYDARGNETQYLSQTWRNNSWVTDYGSQQVYTYNAAGVIIEQIRKELINGVYLNDDREVFTLTNGQWSSLLYQTWEDDTWQDQERLVDIVWYDWAALKPSFYKVQEFNGTTFVDDERNTITYGSNGSSVTIDQDFNGTTWVNDYRGTESYDNLGNYIGYTEEEWVNNAWRQDYGERNLLFYNASNVVLRQVYQRFDDASRQYKNESRSNFSSFRSITLASARNAALEARAALYPNPTTGVVTLDVADVKGTAVASGEVRNALGQLVQQFTAQPQAGRLSTQLDLSGLQAGIYTVRLQTGDGAIVKRVVRN